jgi:hypothetical protein
MTERTDLKNNLKTAVRLSIEEAEKMGTLDEILSESGYEKAGFGVALVKEYHSER